MDDSTIPNDAVSYSITNDLQTKTIKSTGFLITDFYKSNGSYYIVVSCQSRGCTSPNTSITSLAITSPNNTNFPWCNGNWQNIPSACTDSSVAVQVSELNTDEETVNLSWVSGSTTC